jgi:hypothetical protein
MKTAKTLLAIVLSFVISEAPVLAIHGGYELGGAAGTVGTYAGVMIPTAVQYYSGGVAESSTTTTVSTSFGLNSLGLFTFDVPSVGYGAGVIIIFATDQEEGGTITTLPDPANSAGIYGLIAATGSVATATYSDPGAPIFNETFSQISGQASGELYVTTTNNLNSASVNGINIGGTANVVFSTAETDATTGLIGGFVESEEVSYYVDGFQQSQAAVASSGT